MLSPHELRKFQKLSLGALVTILSIAAAAQSPAPQTPVKQPDFVLRPRSYTLVTGTQLVVVDVVVVDQNGKPVRGLKKEDFVVSEGKTPQAIRNFETHTNDQPLQPRPLLPKLPPGTFTNYTPVEPDDTLNVLLLDTLNTPMTDQTFVRNQLQQYVKKADPRARIAIFGLGSQLYLLQGFTSDPEILKDAVEHKVNQRMSSMLESPAGSGLTTTAASDLISGSSSAGIAVAASISALAAANGMQDDVRARHTLDALNDIAHYLSNFPGRKNLIWFSGSFPITFLPEAARLDRHALLHLDSREVQKTSSILNSSRVAVYPVDARGLMGNPAFNATTSGRQFAPGGGMSPGAAAGSAISAFDRSQLAVHTSMDQLAESTGGHAFYNTNGLAETVALALNSGANFYTLTYDPSNQNWDGNYRSINVALTGQYAGSNLQLSYRHGYYANDSTPHIMVPIPGRESSETLGAPRAPTLTRAERAYGLDAVSHGAPLPEDILFKVRAVPASSALEDTLAPNNQPDPTKPIQGPFRRYAIDYAALASDFELRTNASGNKTGAIDFSAYLYSPDGLLLNATGSTVHINVPTGEYENFSNAPISYHLEISAPVKGDSYLRIIVHDVRANHYGAVEVPVSAISKLPPAVPATPLAEVKH